MPNEENYFSEFLVKKIHFGCNSVPVIITHIFCPRFEFGRNYVIINLMLRTTRISFSAPTSKNSVFMQGVGKCVSA